MALNDYESSVQNGEPVELYQIQYGETASFYYTDGDREVVYDGETYVPHTIERGTLDAKTKLERSELSVKVPLNSPIADLFRIYPPGRVVNITIRQGHIAGPNDPLEWSQGENFPVTYQGRILEASRDGNTCDLTCELVSASMRRPGLRRHYQWPCPLALYGSRCNADRVAATYTGGVVESLTGNTVTMQETPEWRHHTIIDPDPTADPPVVGGTEYDFLLTDYLGGELTWTGTLGTERRTILNVADRTITLDGPVTDLNVGDVVSLVLGCPHTLEGCNRVHNNGPNYGGHPFIPSDGNPINKNNHT